MKLRVEFAKYGPMKFIGHLDTMRFFQKAIRRSGIDITYTTGFSPHQVMAFAAPLGVGLESDSEYMDIEVNSCTSSKEMEEVLNEQMCYGFRIVCIRHLPDNTPNAMASVQGAKYTVTFREGREPAFCLSDAVNRFNTSESVMVTKQTKKSTIELDLKPSVFELTTDGNSVSMTVDASSAGNIKPELVIRTLFSFYDTEPETNALMITRNETFGRNDEGKLIPLKDFGSEF